MLFKYNPTLIALNEYCIVFAVPGGYIEGFDDDVLLLRVDRYMYHSEGLRMCL